MINRFIHFVAVCILILFSSVASANITESFVVTTQDVELKDHTSTSIDLRSDLDTYSIKLVPNEKGTVAFSLSGIRYTSTARIPNLLFRIIITGYLDDHIVLPAFSFDDNSRQVYVQQNVITFQRIDGTIPVWFHQDVDSIKIEYSNSHSADVHQYLGIQDLKIIPTIDVSSNPSSIPCQKNHIMFALDGSSSVHKDERRMIRKQLSEFIKQIAPSKDSNQVSILEFGSKVKSIVESSEEKELQQFVKKYKRNRNGLHKAFSWTNWSAAFDEAIKSKPDLFIFLTDGWSNWDGTQPSTFVSQYEQLLHKTNLIKENGTRILFITSNMDSHQEGYQILSQLLNGKHTTAISQDMIYDGVRLEGIDLISVKGFSFMDDLDLESIIKCPSPRNELVQQESSSHGDQPLIIEPEE